MGSSHATQRRGWTPQTLAQALVRAGLSSSKSAILRACEDGQIPHTRTPGGHIRISARWVAQMFPTASHAPLAPTTGERHATASHARASTDARAPIVETRRAPFPSAAR